MSVHRCFYCREEIKPGAMKCKHCGSILASTNPDAPAEVAASVLACPQQEGTLWLPTPAIICSLFPLLVLLDDSTWDEDTIAGFIVFVLAGFILGVVSVSTQTLGKGMAIAAIVVSSISAIAGIGLATG